MPNFHIMIIEDDPHTLDYVYDMLRMHGYNISRWMTYAVVLEQAAQRQPDLVLLDNRLGGH